MKRTFRKCLTLLIMLVCFVPTASAQADVAMDEFNNFNLVYIAPFEAPGKGSYGFMSEVFFTSGFGGAFAFGGLVIPKLTFKKNRFSATLGVPLTYNNVVDKIVAAEMIGVGYEFNF